MSKPRPWRKTGKTINCITCKESFYNRKSEKRKFCSLKCYYASLRGISNSTKGKKFPNRSGKNHPRFVGRIKSVDGHIWILMPSHPFAMRKQYIYEHRLVIERIVGRYLSSKETVHHIGEKDDNRPEMLILFKNKIYHFWFHKKGFCDPKGIIFDGRKLIH